MKRVTLFGATILLLIAFTSIINANTISKSSEIDKTHSVVSRLDPVLRKALLKALSNLERQENEAADGGGSAYEDTSDSNDFDKIYPSTVKSNDELLDESTTSDQTPAIQYHTYAVDGNKKISENEDNDEDDTNNTDNNDNNDENKNDDDDSNENEIIRTIIVKTPKKTYSPPFIDDELNAINNNENEKKIKDIRFVAGALDPLKDNEIHFESVQIARSVATSVNANDINSNSNSNDQSISINSNSNNNINKDIGKTSEHKKPTKVLVRKTTTTTTTTTTTPAPTHNEDGENIEHVNQNDVKIYSAPLVAAFTVQQDGQGLPKHVIPLIKSIPTIPRVAKPIQEFSINIPSSGVTQQTPAFINAPPSPTTFTFTPSSSTVATSTNGQLTATLETPLVTSTPVLTASQLSQYSPFSLEQKQRELEQQIFYLQAQQRQQEELFRQHNFFNDQNTFQRQQQQQQFNFDQRQRIEEENRLRYRYEQEQRLKQQQQQQQQQQQEQFQQYQQQQQQIQLQQQRFVAPPSSVQIVPSLSFPSPIHITTHQLLPIREPIEFRSRETNPFDQQSQTQQQQQQQLFNSFPQQLSQIQQPSQIQLAPFPTQSKQFQQSFATAATTSNNNNNNNNNVQTIQSFSQQPIDPITSSTTFGENRNRVFRSQLDTGNAGGSTYNNNNNNAFFRSNSQQQQQPAITNLNSLQNLLYQSGISGRQQQEDLNIITKVLALNHGIPGTNGQNNNNNLRYNNDSRRFK